MFDKLVWKQDRVVVDDLVFLLEHGRGAGGDEPDPAGNHLVLHKVKYLMDDYARFWSSKPDFRPRNIFEIGIWGGGSLAFWFEHFQPHKLVAIDLSTRGDSNAFRHYVESRGLSRRIKTHWGVNQADSAKLRDIVEDEFEGPLDLVIDDGSHWYEETRTSFNTLFPLLRPGGLYIIEDWSWACGTWIKDLPEPWSTKRPLIQLVFDLIEAIGIKERLNTVPKPRTGYRNEALCLLDLRTLIRRVDVFTDFVVAERGDVGREDLGEFALAQYTSLLHESC